MANREQWRVIAGQLADLLRSVTLDGMGGMPDLFGPDVGWDEWDRSVVILLSAFDSLTADEKRAGP